MGWTNLEAGYINKDTFYGERVGIISASINRANYRNALILKYNKDGIYLKPIILFRMFHKPVLIPWKEIKEVRDKRILFNTLKELVIGQPVVATITITEEIYRKIESNLVQYSLPV